MAVYYQILGTAILCLLCLTMGIMFAWPSSTLLLFSSANTTLNRPMTEGELALLGSLSSVGALIASPLAGIFLDRIGRKPCAMAAASTATIAWAIIAVCDQVEVILVAIFISGLSCSAFLINTSYITEITQESIRGCMTSSIMVFYNLGMLISYVLGGYLEYRTMVYANLALSVVALALLFVMKESPMFLLSKGLEEEAKKSLSFYRNLKVNSKEIQNEVEVLRRALNAEADDECTPEEEKLKTNTNKEKLTTWQFFKKSRSTQRATVVTLTLMTAAIFQGLPVLQVYAEPLFAQAAPNLSPNLCSIVFAAINVVAGFAAAYLTDVAGRRLLLNCGSLATGLCCLLLASQIHVNWGPSWLTAVAIYAFSIVYMLGAGTVPFVLIGEVYLPEVKNIILMLVVEWTWLCNFLILLIFNPLVTAIGLGPVFYIFSGIAFLTSVYGYFYLPETKGLTIDAIQPLFTPKRKRQIV